MQQQYSNGYTITRLLAQLVCKALFVRVFLEHGLTAYVRLFVCVSSFLLCVMYLLHVPLLAFCSPTVSQCYHSLYSALSVSVSLSLCR